MITKMFSYVLYFHIRPLSPSYFFLHHNTPHPCLSKTTFLSDTLPDHTPPKLQAPNTNKHLYSMAEN